MEKMELVDFLKSNVDVFARSVYDASGIDPEFISHQLNVNPGAISRRQPPRHFSKEHAEVVREEVNKLKQARAIKEAFYPKWLANAVVIRKKNGKWRTCVDFKDLNKIGRNIVAYIDDFVVKSKQVLKHLKDLKEEIEVNPDQIKAITDLHPPRNPKEALLRKSNYTGRIAKWGTMPGAFDIKYLPHVIVKEQVLADFVAEFIEDVARDKDLGSGALVVSISSLAA
ncbi:uncharacterized protein LOC126705050 [Quercus robur]|uniref:uncharacterized protein LOC126705050 n=1 Tax=Quercus robur TaxID=38942 RepID=UPI002163C99A|nr:uncharacterized protein LOC126705050 [Quercus robur]